jgi:ROS/MUCR transcriptional regulator protein
MRSMPNLPQRYLLRSRQPFTYARNRGWAGPVHGHIGVLADDGYLAQCHCCGRWFGHLGAHVRRVHELSPDRYRDIFGLNSKTGLMGPALKEQRRAHAEQHLAAVRLQALASANRRPPVDPHQRPQSIRHLNSASMQQLRTRIGTPTWKRRAGTGRFPEGRRLTQESGQRGRQRLKDLRKDPGVRAAMRANNAAAQRAPAAREPLVCSICGTRIEGPRSRRKKTCSEACRRLAQRATGPLKARAPSASRR